MLYDCTLMEKKKSKQQTLGVAFCQSQNKNTVHAGPANTKC